MIVVWKKFNLAPRAGETRVGLVVVVVLVGGGAAIVEAAPGG